MSSQRWILGLGLIVALAMSACGGESATTSVTCPVPACLGMVNFSSTAGTAASSLIGAPEGTSSELLVVPLTCIGACAMGGGFVINAISLSDGALTGSSGNFVRMGYKAQPTVSGVQHFFIDYAFPGVPYTQLVQGAATPASPYSWVPMQISGTMTGGNHFYHYSSPAISQDTVNTTWHATKLSFGVGVSIVSGAAAIYSVFEHTKYTSAIFDGTSAATYLSSFVSLTGIGTIRQDAPNTASWLVPPRSTLPGGMFGTNCCRPIHL